MLALVGPTGSGKNTAAVEAVVRAALPLQIISLDSMKVFKRLDIGTSKPTLEQRRAVPHFALDVVEPWEPFDGQQYQRVSKAAEAEIRRAGAVPLYVGGTGLYLKFLAHGQFDGPGADPAIRAELHARAATAGPPALHAELQRLDPISATRIHPNDEKRLVRALEVIRLTGQPISAMQTQFNQPRSDIRLKLLGLQWPTEALDARINERCAEMFEQGWIEETRRIRDETPGFGPQSKEALGYREILEHLAGVRGRPETVDLVAQLTRRFARRQMTWFRRFEIEWLPIDPIAMQSTAGRDALINRVAAALRSAALES